MQKNFKRHLDSLAEVFTFIDQFAGEEQVDADAKHDLSLAIDELFTNMVKYQPLNPNEITVEVRAEDNMMTVQLTDRDVDRFDLTIKPDPDLGANIDNRKPGGLGIYLVKKFVDDVQYLYGDRSSVIILKKKFRRKNV